MVHKQTPLLSTSHYSLLCPLFQNKIQQVIIIYVDRLLLEIRFQEGKSCLLLELMDICNINISHIVQSDEAGLIKKRIKA